MPKNVLLTWVMNPSCPHYLKKHGILFPSQTFLIFCPESAWSQQILLLETDHIQNQLEEDKMSDQISIKEYIDPFTGTKNPKA